MAILRANRALAVRDGTWQSTDTLSILLGTRTLAGSAELGPGGLRWAGTRWSRR